MKKFTKIAVCGLLASLSVTAMASCGGGDDLAREVINKVILTQDGEKVSADFAIPKIVKYEGTTYDVAWTSSDTSVLNIVEKDTTSFTADVKRPFDENAEVTLTATVEVKGKKASADFKTTVKVIDFEQAAVSTLGIGASYNREDLSEPVVIDLPTSTNEFKDVINYSYNLDGTPTTVTLEGNKLTIDPSSGAKEVADLKVKATSSVTKDIVVKVNVNQVTYSTIEEYDALAAGDNVTVKGIIVAREPYAESYKNTTLYLQDISGKGGYDAYRIKCASAEAYENDLAIGNAILVTGQKALYNGLREFNTGCTYELASKGKEYNDTDVTDMIKADVAQVSLDLQCQLIHFSNLTVVKVGEEDTKGRWNITVGDASDSKKQFVVRIDTGLLPIDTDAYKAIKALNIAVGDVISAKGVAGWSYNAQLLPLAADSIVVEQKGGPAPTPVAEPFTGVVTAIGFKPVDKNNNIRCYVLVQNADSEAKFVYIEAPVTAENTEEAIKAAINAKFVVGKSVTVTGISKDYSGLNQWSVAWDKLDTDVVLGEVGTIPAYLDVTAKVGNENDLKALQGVLVKVTGTYNSSGTLVVEGGKSIAVYYEAGFLDTNPLTELKNGGKYTITGYLNWYNKPQISPLSADAVTLVSDPEPSDATELANCSFDNKTIVGNFTYISNDPVNYPNINANSGWNNNGAALKLSYEGQGVKSPVFVAVNSCIVTINIQALNGNTRTSAASTDIFTVKAYNAAGEVVDTKTLTAVVVGDENVVELSGTGIVSVEVVMTGYPHNGEQYCNIALAGVVVSTTEEVDIPTPTPTPDLTEYLTVAEALDQSVDTMIFVQGQIKSFASEQYGNIWIVDEAGNEIEIYGLYKGLINECYDADNNWLKNGTRYDAWDASEKLAVGDYIYVYGKRAAYNETQEISNCLLMHSETPVPVAEPFTGVVTAVGFKDVSDNKMRCYALVQNADNEAKFVYIEAPIDATNTVEVAKAAFNAKFVVGKSVTVTGTSNDYQGLNQWLVAWDKLDTDVVLGEAGTVPAVLDITAKVENKDDLTGLQGVLVKVTGTYKESSGALVVEGDQSITVYYEAGFLDTNPLTVLKNGGKYTVTGYLNWYNKPQVSPLSADAVTIIDESGVGITADATVEGTKITSADLGFENAHQVAYIQFTDGLIHFEKGTGSTNPTYYNTGLAIRLYKGNVMTFTSEKKIVKIEFTVGTNTETKLDEANTTVNVGSMDWTTLTWTGEANEVVFTVDSSTSDKPRIVSIVVTYAE